VAAEPGTRLVLVRHGESNVTVNRVIGGHRSCSGLSDLGRQQAERLAGRWVDNEEFAADVLVTSDFARAIETGAIIMQSLGAAVSAVEPTEMAGFGEHDPGPDIDGMTFQAYIDEHGSPDWAGDPDTVIFPGGETMNEFHARVHGAIDDLVAEHGAKTTVVACHGGVIDATFRRLLRLGVTGSVQLQALNTSITEIVSTESGTWRLERYNDAAHLAGLPARTERSAPRTDG